MNEKKILIVDDETDLRQTLREAFEYFNWKVDEANNGQVAFEKILKQRYHAILSDIKMPKTDGIELLRLLSLDYKTQTPIFMITAYSDYSEQSILKLGARKLLSKPIGIQQLLNEVNLLCKK